METALAAAQKKKVRKNELIHSETFLYEARDFSQMHSHTSTCRMDAYQRMLNRVNAVLQNHPYKVSPK